MAPQLKQIKNSFFKKEKKTDSAFNFKADDFSLNELDAEFSSLYQLFISNKKKWENDRNNDVVEYMAELCDLMIAYYQVYYVREKLDDLQSKQKEIDSFRNPNSNTGKTNVPPTKSSFIGNKLADALYGLGGSSSQLRGNLSFVNSYRIYWIYCRGLVKEMVAFLQANGFADYLNQLNIKEGPHYSPNDFLKMLEKPQPVLYVLSVGIYALRFMIDLVSMTRYIVEAKLGNELSSEQVFIQEMEKRGFSMLNDAVWGTVNLLTNYNKQFHISDTAANNATLVFLAFDAALLTAQWLFDARKYKHRLSELTQERGLLTLPSQSTQLSVVQRQIDMLNDEWEAQSAFYGVNILAASFIVVGFGASLILSGGLGLAFLSMVGNGLYATADEYKNYAKSTIAIQRERANGALEDNDEHRSLMKQLTNQSGQAYSEFWKRLAYNTAGPAFIITTAAFSWPLALLVTAAYMTYNNTYKENPVNEKQSDVNGVYRLFDKSSKTLASDMSVTNDTSMAVSAVN
ncbi:TPA: hypothetical protein ACPSKB_003296 [Legionella feeleii]